MGFFSNINDRRLPVLEQVCERFAIMAYEVFYGKLAYGFKSITYSYEDGESPRLGQFKAQFVASVDDWKQGLMPNLITTVTFYMLRGETGEWILSHGLITDNAGRGSSVEFLVSSQVKLVMREGTEYIYGHGPDSKRQRIGEDGSETEVFETLIFRKATVAR